MGKLDRVKKLSICMMVKDEEKNLERCFESIKPLIDREDVELIVVDTGSEDNSVDIIKNYTTKLYFHKWNDNFSEMRNVTISYATGEWIFILDADEELVDPFELMDLLNSKKMKEFNAISLLIKNFLTKSGTEQSIFPALRIFRYDEDFRYDGVVHNQPVFKQPTLETEILLNHYGYFNDDKVLMEKKFRRTATLLKSELEKDPNNVYYQYQLAKSYIMHGDYEDGLNQIEVAYNVMQKKQTNRSQSYIYNVYARVALHLKQFDKVIEIAEEGIGYRKDYIDLYFLLGKAKYNKKMNNEALNAYRNYLKLYKQGNDLGCLKDLSLEIKYIDEKSKDSVVQDMVYIMIEQEEFETAKKLLNEVDDSSIRNKALGKIYLAARKLEDLCEHYDSLNESSQQELEYLIEDHKSRLSDDEKTDLEISLSHLSSPYSLLNNARNSSDPEVIKNIANDLINKHNLIELPIFYCEIITLCLKNNISLFRYFKNFDSNSIQKMMNFVLNSAADSKWLIINYLNNIKPIRDNDYNNNRIYYSIVLPLLIAENQEATIEKRNITDEFIDLFERYIKSGKNAVRIIYNKDKLKLYYQTINDAEHKLFCLLLIMDDAIAKQNIKASLKYLKETVTTFKSLSKFYDVLFINTYIEFGDIFKKQNKMDDAIEMYEEALLKSMNEKQDQFILEQIENCI
ncbi:tetratricopeptide repeat-containing glycosyltransferase family 2 protein [Gracilibacillus dipsosauri]|uniref:tetratricopeptide repeat-containing glycosyltransferase family 2 protein n=1 Tax=Gracilibacillus dipsosauri TaxID=178340 RepID=UPI002409E2DC